MLLGRRLAFLVCLPWLISGADLFGYQLRVTTIAAADELAMAASLVMGQADEAQLLSMFEGFPSARDTS